jgi:hypothetical protein
MSNLENTVNIAGFAQSIRDTANGNPSSNAMTVVAPLTQAMAGLAAMAAASPINSPAIVGLNTAAAIAAIIKINQDINEKGKSDPSDWVGLAGNIVNVVAHTAATVHPGVRALGIALGIAGVVIGNNFTSETNPGPPSPGAPNPGIPTPGTCRPSDAVGTSFDAAQRPPRRDPLMLDLNGDGEISHIGTAQSSAYFDHDLDGVRTRTGWVSNGDGLLVLDVNGNGTIDNGSELFGDHFTKTHATAAGAAGQFARDGFDALASLDTNADGYVDAADAQFAQLKVWVDANGDGISQAGELRSLAAATTNAAGTPVGITRFNVTPSAVTTTNTANGNQTAAQGSFQTTAGTSATLDSVTMQDVNLGQDTFHSQFIDAIPITTAAAQLAFMNGSGLVRNTQEAASLNTVQGAAFAANQAIFKKIAY